MSSPVMHTVVVFFIYRFYLRVRYTPANPIPIGRSGIFLVAAIAFSLLPDLDAILAISLSDFSTFHNNWTHSLFFGLLVSIAIGLVARWKREHNFLTWFTIALLCYELHVIMDFFTIGRGVKLFWPLCPERYSSPIKLFYGLHWSDGLVSMRHLMTFITEIGLVLVLISIVALLKKRKEVITIK